MRYIHQNYRKYDLKDPLH